MPTHKSHKGQTPAGGVRSDIVYMDDKGNVVAKKEATWAKIRELDKDGKVILETFGAISRGGWILDDRSVNYLEYPIYGKQCAGCKHLSLERPTDGIGSKCAAFTRIPREILDGQHDHTLPFPGNNGIRFEPK
ncbi:MAG: hypothetical protein KGZ45_09845 [Clostridium sp.]|nr:hypothetical protein [Clostridium sp.]